MRNAFVLVLMAAMACAPAAHAQDVYHSCPMAGSAKNQRAATLNRLKNRYLPPTDADFDTTVTLAAMVRPGNDVSRFDEGRAAVITGYVADVKPGGIETTNCGARDLPDRDTHISLVPDPMQHGLPVIVEVTPRWRAMMAPKGVDWSTATLRKTLLGRWVKVTGWLLFDSEHANAAENTAPGRPRNWRQTAWEIHPITSLEVVPRPTR